MPGRGRGWLAAIALTALLLVPGLPAGCGGGRGDGEPADPPPAVAKIATWGRVYLDALDSFFGVTHEADNVALLGNLLAELARGRGTPGEHRILYGRSCDPRTDPGLCGFGLDLEDLDDFYAMIAQLGTIEYATPGSGVTLSDYSVVILDFCVGLLPAEEALVTAYLRSGGRLLVCAQTSCFASPSAANEFLKPYGIEFTSLDPATEYVDIPPAERTGLLEGVTRVYVFRMTPHVTSSEYVEVLASTDGTLAAIATFDPNTLP